MQGEKLITKAYWDKVAETLWFCPAWKADFEVFYKEAGARPSPDAKLRRLDDTRMFEPGNVEWVGFRRKPGPVPKLSQAVVLEILDLGHNLKVSSRDIQAMTPNATLKDVQDILAGRRYIIPVYNYKAQQAARITPSIAREVVMAYEAGASVEALAAKYRIEKRKVFAILARG